MRYDVNDEFPQVREVWKKNFGANIAAGFAVNQDNAFFPLACGAMLSVSLKNGSVKWRKDFPGKIYSTPALSGKYLVFGCSDGNIYALNASDGTLKWKFQTGKAVLASPVILDGKVFIGGSDGAFRCIELKTGKAVWTYGNVEGHAVSTPYADGERVIFGTWGGKLYSLDSETGRENWVWSVGKASKMYSPASTLPLYSSGMVFVAVPDRQVYAIDAATGRQLFRVKEAGMRYVSEVTALQFIPRKCSEGPTLFLPMCSCLQGRRSRIPARPGWLTTTPAMTLPRPLCQKGTESCISRQTRAISLP